MSCLNRLFLRTHNTLIKLAQMNVFPCRWHLESIGELEPRISALEDDFEEEEEKEEDRIVVDASEENEKV